MMRAMLAVLWPQEYQLEVQALVEIRGIMDDPEELLQVMESEGIAQKIVQEHRRQNAAVARNKSRNEKDKACKKST